MKRFAFSRVRVLLPALFVISVAGCLPLTLPPEPEVVSRVDMQPGYDEYISDLDAVAGVGLYTVSYLQEFNEDPTPGNVAVMDGNGEEVWSRATTRTSWIVAAEANGNSYVVGTSDQGDAMLVERRNALGNQMSFGVLTYPVATRYGFGITCHALSPNGSLLVGSNAGGDEQVSIVSSILLGVTGDSWHAVLRMERENAKVGMLALTTDADGNVYALYQTPQSAWASLQFFVAGGGVDAAQDPVYLYLNYGTTLVKLGPGGDLLWQAGLQDRYAMWEGLGMDVEGNVRVATSTSRFVQYANPEDEEPRRTTYIKRVSPEGRVLSSHAFDWPSTVRSTPRLAIDPSGNFYFCARTVASDALPQDRDVLLVFKVDAQAHKQWQWLNRAHTPYGHIEIAVDAQENVYVLAEAVGDANASIVRLRTPRE